MCAECCDFALFSSISGSGLKDKIGIEHVFLSLAPDQHFSMNIGPWVFQERFERITHIGWPKAQIFDFSHAECPVQMLMCSIAHTNFPRK